jgi:hypothetical protein
MAMAGSGSVRFLPLGRAVTARGSSDARPITNAKICWHSQEKLPVCLIAISVL